MLSNRSIHPVVKFFTTTDIEVKKWSWRRFVGAVTWCQGVGTDPDKSLFSFETVKIGWFWWRNGWVTGCFIFSKITQNIGPIQHRKISQSWSHGGLYKKLGSLPWLFPIFRGLTYMVHCIQIKERLDFSWKAQEVSNLVGRGKKVAVMTNRRSAVTLLEQSFLNVLFSWISIDLSRRGVGEGFDLFRGRIDFYRGREFFPRGDEGGSPENQILGGLLPEGKGGVVACRRGKWLRVFACRIQV